MRRNRRCNGDPPYRTSGSGRLLLLGALVAIGSGCRGHRVTAVLHEVQVPVLVGPITRIGGEPEPPPLATTTTGRVSHTQWTVPMPYNQARTFKSLKDDLQATVRGGLSGVPGEHVRVHALRIGDPMHVSLLGFNSVYVAIDHSTSSGPRGVPAPHVSEASGGRR